MFIPTYKLATQCDIVDKFFHQTKRAWFWKENEHHPSHVQVEFDPIESDITLKKSNYQSCNQGQ
jgi:hypothetical protein